MDHFYAKILAREEMGVKAKNKILALPIFFS